MCAQWARATSAKMQENGARDHRDDMNLFINHDHFAQTTIYGNVGSLNLGVPFFFVLAVHASNDGCQPSSM